jgi:hypothetical protein
MNCSERCFQDEIAKQYIRKHGARGGCDLTGETGVMVLEAGQLLNLFEPLLKMYGSSAEAAGAAGTSDRKMSLFECIREDKRWRVFNQALTNKEGCRLLDAIRGYRPDGGLRPSEASWFAHNSGELTLPRDWWAKFSESIKHQWRFFPRVSGHRPQDPRSVLAPHLPKFVYTLAKGKKVYRARIGERDTSPTGKRRPFPPGQQIGAPPASMAGSGRANPTGVSFLYCADEEATAIAEVQPYVGASVSVARFEASQRMKLVDASKVRHLFSPLGCKDLSSMLPALELLEVLNEQLSMPISPHAAEIDYLPTQYLAEVVRAEGYDGIRYNSGLVADGTNLVFFDQSKTLVIETKLVDILQIAVRYRDVTQY